MIDMVGELTKYLRTNAALMTAVSSKVYCDEIPEQAEPPYVLLRELSATPAAPPTLAYDIYAIQADIYAAVNDYPGARSVASQVRTLLHAARGVRGAARVTSVTVSTALAGVDSTGSPAHPRWVLTVDVTGRSN